MVKNPPANAGNVGDMGSSPRLDDPLEEEMKTHSSVLAWRIPGTGEPGGLPSMGSHMALMLGKTEGRRRGE